MCEPIPCWFTNVPIKQCVCLISLLRTKIFRFREVLRFLDLRFLAVLRFLCVVESGGMEAPQGGGDEPEGSNPRRGRKYHRHTPQQITRLEEVFKDCPHPDDNQRNQLSRELGLETKQIKFWFQNKRTQTKTHGERADNSFLRTENEKIHCENHAIRESLKDVICPNCGGPPFGEEERQLNLQRLQLENARLKEEHHKVACLLSQFIGKPLSHVEALLASPAAAGTSMEQGMAGSSHNPNLIIPSFNPNLITPPLTNSALLAYQLKEIPAMEKKLIKDTAASAMDELIKIFQIDEPLWNKSPVDGRNLLNRDSYDKIFPKSSHFRASSARFESSKDSGVVAMTPLQLVDSFLDASKWEDLFPTIVTKANTLEVIETGMLGSRSGCLQLMYEQMHILSPLVLPRDFYFLRYCQQVDLGTWVIVDVSVDNFPKDCSANQMRSWRLPSGCMIEDILNGCSKITWIEHVEVDDKTQTHRLYRDLICSGVAYGAERWILTLQRMCERFDCLMVEIAPTNEISGVISSTEGKRSVMKLSQRMMKNFCGILGMSGKLDFPQLSEVHNSGVRVSVRKTTDPGQPNGTVVSVATSLWLPLPCHSVFNFFKDEKSRIQWDVLCNGNPVHEIAHISTGVHPGNVISIIRPFVATENNMLLLQESYIDPLGCLVIYAPVDLTSLKVAVCGEDPSEVAILPSGFVISGDGRPEAGPSSSHGRIGGSLLTVAFQILVASPTSSKQLNMESVATVNTLISSTVQKIKAALNCSGLD